MIRKFHLAKLAVRGDWEGISRDERQFGGIPEDIRASLKALAKPKQPDPALPPPAVRLWGSGNPKREFLHVDDAASACIYLINLPDDKFDAIKMLPCEAHRPESKIQPIVSHINVGTGERLVDQRAR